MTTPAARGAVAASTDQSSSKCSRKVIFSSMAGAIVIAIIIFSVTYFGGKSDISDDVLSGESDFDDSGRFIMKNFDRAKPMSDFLNGLGGLWGVPMWAFYVNRGQALTSFGLKNKDGEIERFVTAEKAYQQTPFTGFRTFVKGSRKNSGSFQHQPFFPQPIEMEKTVSRDMKIGLNDLELEEVHKDLGLQTNIVYFTTPNEDFASLVRKVTFTNLDPEQELELEVVDGLSKIIPSGLWNPALDSMGRTSEAWMRVYNVGKASAGGAKITAPFYHITQTTADTALVTPIKDGYFAVSFVDTSTSTSDSDSSSDGNGGDSDSDTAAKTPGVDPQGFFRPLPYIVDPTVVFGQDTALLAPTNFFAADAPSIEEFVLRPQGTTARTPCAFTGTKLTIPAGQSVSITSVYGYAPNLETFVGNYSPQLRTPGFAHTKRSSARDVVDDLTKNVATTTGSIIFDQYVRQDYLDNTLRGGLPLLLGDPEEEDKSKVFHVFSRIHGDVERDYNNFDIDTTYFSQGPGNFRDVSQNRRLDVTLAPYVKDFNVRMFLSFVQADGYNPLTVASTNFKIPEDAVHSLVKSLDIAKKDKPAIQAVTDILSKPFRPGQFFQDCAKAGVSFGIAREDVLNKIIAASQQEFAALFNQNAFWADHWTYTLDLVHDFLNIYPDKEEHLLWESKPVPFFLSPAFVLPRKHRYSVVDNPNKPGANTIRAYRSITVWGDKDFPIKLNNALLKNLDSTDYIADSTGAANNWMRDENGHVFKVSVAAKLLMLGTIKFSTMDPYGMGVEMEGGKPGWNDAMNGLPGLLGSGMPETYEMLKILQFMSGALKKHKRSVDLPVEYADFLKDIATALNDYNSALNDLKDDLKDDLIPLEFKYWNATNNAREYYRGDVMAKFDGEFKTLSADYLVDLLEAMEAKVHAGIDRAVADNDGFSPTYFSYECTDLEILPPFEVTDPPQPPVIVAKAFKQHSLPLFLEGPTRHMKVLTKTSDMLDLYEKARTSTLYDSALQMFTLSESLKEMGADVGRMVGFSPGWLENQSVWLHMSYKFYLELLRGGLYDQFFHEIKTGLVSFMDPEVYGRSPLEAASFIVSSAFPDKSLHGTGFLARLSGSTAEFLSMWTLMMAGDQPFSLDKDGQLQLSFNPIIPGWLFPEDGIVKFTFLGAVEVVYNNPSRADTWKIRPVQGTVTSSDGNVYESGADAVFGTEAALKVRKLQAASIYIDYGAGSDKH